VLRLVRPASEEIDRHLTTLDDAFSYSEVGATADLSAPLPEALEASYDVDRREFELGAGRDLFVRAADALMDWRNFGVPWVGLYGAGSPVEPGQVVASLVRVLGVWFLNPCRVVWVEPPSETSTRVGFAYGTLRGHAEHGEERFAVRFDPSSGRVDYEISAFSRPAGWLPRLGYPLARRVQRRFAIATADALARAISTSRPEGRASGR